MARFDLGIAAGFGLDALAEAGMLAGASIDMDFAGNRIYGASSFTSALAITRASTGYAENAAGVWSSFASGALRITDKGILIEEARTNSIRNNSMQGAVAGTPGTVPTNWVISASGLSYQVVGSGAENGVDYVDIRLYGTTGGTFGNISFDSLTQIAAANGQVWAGSVFLKLAGGSLTNVSSTAVRGGLYSSVPGYLGEAWNPTLRQISTTLTRYKEAGTIANASTASIQPYVQFVWASGVAVDFTIRIGWPQHELGAFATSPIRTTSAAATRAADVVTVNSPTNYVSLAQGSVFVEWQEGPGASSTVDEYLTNLFVDGSNLIGFRSNAIGASRKPFFGVITGGVVQASLSTTNAVSAGATSKLSGAWVSNRFALRVPAAIGSPANDTSGLPPTGVPTFNLGHYSGGAGSLNGYIRRLTLFPSPQSDAALSAMVA